MYNRSHLALNYKSSFKILIRKTLDWLASNQVVYNFCLKNIIMTYNSRFPGLSFESLSGFIIECLYFKILSKIYQFTIGLK